MTKVRKEQLADNVTLYCGDSTEILPTLSRVDVCVTDPPYGIKRDGQTESTGKHGGRKGYEFKGWDGERPSPEVFKMILKVSKNQIIWGGNYFADLLPPTSKWLVWDKGQRISQSDGELAWTSYAGALRIFELNRVALAQDVAEHPTQKPVWLMEKCILELKDCSSVIDPFMGSGTTGIAAVRYHKGFIGIERDPDYFEIALRRIKKELSQDKLF